MLLIFEIGDLNDSFITNSFHPEQSSILHFAEMFISRIAYR